MSGPFVDWDDSSDDDPRCDVCNRPFFADELTITDFGQECRDCSGLARCPDDLCHGQGWCMHRDAA